MEKLYISVLSFWNSIVSGEKEKGATATEYALLVGLIALAIAGAVFVFGGNLSTFFTNLGNSVNNWSTGKN
ncbi:Flp family type IVb pilin [Sinomonas atrocyanea]|uniref:Flp family type IVb pilin n=1 Tax=Sinomonas atrocyanea TaxID=37927 RepID=UPI00285D78BE|nr:Flp family type IVb pilin [Sinomonas atrocyanea]MDR6620907.1 pilus assembly protein Flp/PilA [Sinomonas atrocyanea]